MSDADETGRNPTEFPPSMALMASVHAPRRELALAALLSGATVTRAAEAAGVTRQTVSGWLHDDAEFAEEFAARRRELWESARRGLEARVVEAVNTLRGLLRDDDPHVRVAACRVVVAVLAASGPQGQGPSAAGDSNADAARRVLAGPAE